MHRHHVPTTRDFTMRCPWCNARVLVHQGPGDAGLVTIPKELLAGGVPTADTRTVHLCSGGVVQVVRSDVDAEPLVVDLQYHPPTNPVHVALYVLACLLVGCAVGAVLALVLA